MWSLREGLKCIAHRHEARVARTRNVRPDPSAFGGARPKFLLKKLQIYFSFRCSIFFILGSALCSGTSLNLGRPIVVPGPMVHSR